MTLKEARLSSGLKQKFVAEQLGVSPQTISAWENGKTNIPVQQAKKLCKLYGVNINKIFS